MRLIPAPRGTGLVAAVAPKKLLTFAGLQDCYTASTGHTCTKGIFLKVTFVALKKSYGFLSPDLWGDYYFERHFWFRFTSYWTASLFKIMFFRLDNPM